MEIALMKYFGVRQNLIVPNISWGLYIHECDLLVVKKSGYAIEVEIKVSVQDFKKDFKKGHQHNDKFNRIKSMYYAFPKSIVDKCVDLVPENCGIISVRKYNGECYCQTIRGAKNNKKAEKLTDKDIQQIGRLGTMRILGLKQKINKLLNKQK
jgi:hypothetical protein